jgi:2-oxo-3-hexenedioate decarboxylase
VRKAHRENTVGRKIGFTNRTVWSGYGISGPIWTYTFDSTVHDLPPAGGSFALGLLPEPRIEPDIALHIASTPQAGMDEG